MDYNSLTDEQLNEMVKQRMAGVAQPTLTQTVQPVPEYNSMSDSDLDAAVKAKMKAQGKDPSDLSGYADSLTVKQEMPADVSMWDRFKISNFANAPQVKYMQEKYPEYDVGHDGNQLLMKKKGTNEWSVLNPELSTNTFEHPTEGLQKLAGNIYPLAQGAASNAAADLAAGATAMSPAAPAALPAGMAAGGATNAGLEALRVELGKVLGLHQQQNMGDLLTTGAVGATSPLLFGTGGSSQSIVKGALQKGLTKDAAEAAATWQKGLIPGMASKVTSLASGIPTGTIKTAYDRMPEIKALEKDGITPLATAAQERLVKPLANAKIEIGKKLGSAIDATGKQIDMEGAKAPFKDLISRLENQFAEDQSPATKSELLQAKSDFQRIFGKVKDETPLAQDTTGLIDATGTKAVTPQSLSAAEEALPEQVSGRTAFTKQQQLKDLMDFTGSQGGIVTKDGVPVSAKQLQSAAGDSYRNLGTGLEEATGGISPELKGQYQKYSEIQRALAPHFKTPESVYNTLRNLGGKQKRVLFETLQGVDNDLGTNIVNDAKLLDAHSNFGSNLNSISGLGAKSNMARKVPLATLGAGAGYYAGSQGGGHGHGTGVAGALIGGTIASAMGSPSAIRYAYMPAARASGMFSPWLAPGIANSIQQMKEQEDLQRK